MLLSFVYDKHVSQRIENGTISMRPQILFLCILPSWTCFCVFSRVWPPVLLYVGNAPFFHSKKEFVSHACMRVRDYVILCATTSFFWMFDTAMRHGFFFNDVHVGLIRTHGLLCDLMHIDTNYSHTMHACTFTIKTIWCIHEHIDIQQYT